MIERALKKEAAIQAHSLRLDADMVYALMLIGAEIAFKVNREDRIAAENGPGSESIPSTLRINQIPALPVHPKK